MYNDLLEGQLSFKIEPLVILETDKDIAAVHAIYNQQYLTISTNSLRKPSTTHRIHPEMRICCILYMFIYMYMYIELCSG